MTFYAGIVKEIIIPVIINIFTVTINIKSKLRCSAPDRPRGRCFHIGTHAEPFRNAASSSRIQGTINSKCNCLGFLEAT